MMAVSCNHNKRFLDLSTNKYVDVRKDTTTGQMVNAKTGVPVEMYVDTKTHDTVYGTTGETVNGRIYKNPEGQWAVKLDGEEYKTKSEAETKVKVEGNEYKYKNRNYSIKKESDGDIKIENGNTETKIDGKTGERTVKKDHNITGKATKILH